MEEVEKEDEGEKAKEEEEQIIQLLTLPITYDHIINSLLIIHMGVMM